MKLIIFLLAFATAVFSAEKFSCTTQTQDEYGFKLTTHLDAVYIKGVLKAKLSTDGYSELCWEYHKDRGTVNARFGDLDIKSVKVGSVRTTEELDEPYGEYKYAYSFWTDSFSMKLTQDELDVIKTEDEYGRPCLNLSYTASTWNSACSN